MFWKDSGGGLWKFWSENKVLWTFVRLGYHSTVDLLGCAASRQSIEERDMQREMESTLCLPGEILRRDGQSGRWDGKWDGDWLGLATTELQHAGGVWSPSVTCRTAVTFNLSFSCQIKPLLSLSLSPAYNISLPSDFVWSRKKSQNNSETWRQTLAKNIQIKMFDICKVTQTGRDKTDWTCRGSNGQASSCHSEREREVQSNYSNPQLQQNFHWSSRMSAVTEVSLVMQEEVCCGVGLLLIENVFSSLTF